MQYKTNIETLSEQELAREEWYKIQDAERYSDWVYSGEPEHPCMSRRWFCPAVDNLNLLTKALAEDPEADVITECVGEHVDGLPLYEFSLISGRVTWCEQHREHFCKLEEDLRISYRFITGLFAYTDEDIPF